MPACQVFPILTGFLRKLRGGSQSILAQANDGQLYVVKFANNLQGKNLLFNEAAGSMLYSFCGLHVSEWCPVEVTKAFWDKYPEAWIETETGRRRPSEGLCFASRYLGTTARIFEILPCSSLARITNRQSFWLAWLVDICAAHTDNRQVIFQSDGLGALDAVFIDHGNMFGGPKGGEQAQSVASRYLDLRVYQYVSSRYLLKIKQLVKRLDTNRLWMQAQQLPGDWKTTSALNGLIKCFDRLSDVQFLDEAIGTLAASNRKALENESTGHTIRRPPHSILCPRVQRAGGEQPNTEYSPCAAIRAAR